MVALLLMVFLLHPSKAEEDSILFSATVPTPMHLSTPDSNVLLHGSYKSNIRTPNTSTNPVDVQVDLNLPQPKKVQTLFLLANQFNVNSADHLGESQIILVNDGVETIMKTGVYDTGLYSFEYPVEATAIILRREESGSLFGINHMRVYQSQNLIQYGATIHY